MCSTFARTNLSRTVHPLVMVPQLLLAGIIVPRTLCRRGWSGSNVMPASYALSRRWQVGTSELTGIAVRDVVVVLFLVRVAVSGGGICGDGPIMAWRRRTTAAERPGRPAGGSLTLGSESPISAGNSLHNGIDRTSIHDRGRQAGDATLVHHYFGTKQLFAAAIHIRSAGSSSVDSRAPVEEPFDLQAAVCRCHFWDFLLGARVDRDAEIADLGSDVGLCRSLP